MDENWFPYVNASGIGTFLIPLVDYNLMTRITTIRLLFTWLVCVHCSQIPYQIFVFVNLEFHLGKFL